MGGAANGRQLRSHLAYRARLQLGKVKEVNVLQEDAKLTDELVSHFPLQCRELLLDFLYQRFAHSSTLATTADVLLCLSYDACITAFLPITAFLVRGVSQVSSPYATLSGCTAA